MTMISVSNVSKGFGGQMLFENVNVNFQPGVNYGLTGPNGAGKSTFMKLLMRELEADSGNVSIPQRTAWLRQDTGFFDAHGVLDTVLMGNKRLWDAMQEKEMLYAKPEITNEDGERLGELEMIVMEEDGYTAESTAQSLLQGLDIPEALHYRKMHELEPGQKLRVLVAQALFGGPDALLLDEPTNHLDIDSIRWLENFLMKYQGVLVVISHDRRFLNVICDQIADIDFQTIILYPGNYDDMVQSKAESRGKMEKEHSDRMKKVEQLQDFINRFRAGSRASQTRSRARQLEKLRPDVIKRSNIARPFINFEIDEQSGKLVLECKDLSFAYGNFEIFHDFNSLLNRGDKIAVVGRNGIGKTTLIKTIVGELEATGGGATFGHNTDVGYFPQDNEHLIQPGDTVYTWLRSHHDDAHDEDLRAMLGRMLFSRQDAEKPTAGLSGGERVRLILSKMMLLKHNVLVLDEPTNHLDLESISALGDAIDRYRGTMIYVTHDRDLASRATRIWAFPQRNELIDYQGSLDEYLEWYDRQKKNVA